MAVRVLQPTDHDVALYRALRLESLQADPGAFHATFEGEAALDDATWRRRLTTGHEGRPVNIFVDETGGDGPVGALSGTAGVGYTEWDPSPMLMAMWVRPEARGSGSADRLVEACLDWVRRDGADETMLWVMEGNDQARRLYERHGFVVSGNPMPNPNDPCVNEIQLRRPMP
jgi:GNAT superfamily N-acetyltransferase